MCLLVDHPHLDLLPPREGRRFGCVLCAVMFGGYPPKLAKKVRRAGFTPGVLPARRLAVHTNGRPTFYNPSVARRRSLRAVVGGSALTIGAATTTRGTPGRFAHVFITCLL